MKKLFVALMVMVMLSTGTVGCATLQGWFCPNGPDVVANLQTTVDSAKLLVDQLGAVLLSGYDAEIEIAYLAAKGTLAAAQALLTQACPDPAAVNSVVAMAQKVTIPQANFAMAKAKKLKLIK
jgi:hypothetical protein